MFIYFGLHESHKAFAEAIGADLMHVYGGKYGGRLKRLFLALTHAWKYPDYDYYLLEGGVPLFPAFLKKLKNRKIKVIELLGDETIINFEKKLPYYSHAEVLVHKIAFRAVDGCIAVSPMLKEIALKKFRGPVEVARPCISKNLFDKLAKVNPDLNSGKIVALGYAKPSLGFDILVEAFKMLKGNLKLEIAGKGWSWVL
ncbi:MAG: hypothetical protein PWQ22_990 [Archaeoglobaceae archaeon]|nr:hypothetical protein [Archaeoglobaceae archaeon]